MAKHYLIDKLIRLRKHYNYSQHYLAQKLGIDVFEYMAFENGRTMLSYVQIKKLAQLFQIDITQLLINSKEVSIQPLKNNYHTDEYDLKELKRIKRQYLINQYISKLKEKRNIFKIVIGLMIVSFFGLIISLLPKENNLRLSAHFTMNDRVSASDNSVIYFDQNNKLKANGDNSNGQLNLEEFKDIVKVKQTNSFTILLDKHGKLHSKGLVSSYHNQLKKLENIVDIAVGSGHILALDQKGQVSCIGDNFFGQCEVSLWSNIKKIYANNHGSVGISENSIFSAGIIPFKEELLNNHDLLDLDFNHETLVLINAQKEVKYFSNRLFNLKNWHDVTTVRVGDDFICGLRSDGRVLIAIENYLIEDEISKWRVKGIDAGKDFIVGYDGNSILGVGNNKFNQFEVAIDKRKQLPQVSNVKLDTLEEDLKISFDKVEKASSYLIEIDVGIGYSIKTKDNVIYLPLSKFEKNKKYEIRITSLSDNDNYNNSATYFFTWHYLKPEQDQKTNQKFKLEELLKKSLSNFEAYLKGLGVPEQNLHKKESTLLCQDKTLEPYIVSVTGIWGGEEIFSHELKQRVINYEYCQLKKTN